MCTRRVYDGPGIGTRTETCQVPYCGCEREEWGLSEHLTQFLEQMRSRDDYPWQTHPPRLLLDAAVQDYLELKRLILAYGQQRHILVEYTLKYGPSGKEEEEEETAEMTLMVVLNKMWRSYFNA